MNKSSKIDIKSDMAKRFPIHLSELFKVRYMARIVLILLLFFSSSTYADSCYTVVEGYEAEDVMYVLCNELPVSNEVGASKLIAKVMGQYKGPPDEIVVYFISSIEQIGGVKPSSENLVGFYYTHSNKLTIWPGLENKKRVFNIQWYQ
jgi:hypothetical protein